MQVRLVRLNELQDTDMRAWSTLQRSHPQLDSPFFRPEFATLVGQVTDRAEVAILETNGHIVGFFPFERQGSRVARGLGGYLADVHGIIGDPELLVDPRQLLRDCKLMSWTFDHLIASQSCFAPYHECLDISPYIDLERGFDGYREERKRAGSLVFSNAGRRERKLSREVGPVRLEWHCDDDKRFSEICQWKQKQLQQLHYADMFGSQYVRDILQGMRAMRSPSFQLVVSILYAGDHAVAAQLGVRSDGVLSSWIPTYNEQYARYSPGMILLMELARQAPEMGIRRIDLGRGENQTKMSFMSNSFPVALGAVDLRLLPTLLRKSWFRMRDLVYSTPLRNQPLSWYRQIRNRLVRQ